MATRHCCRPRRGFLLRPPPSPLRDSPQSCSRMRAQEVLSLGSQARAVNTRVHPSRRTGSWLPSQPSLLPLVSTHREMTGKNTLLPPPPPGPPGVCVGGRLIPSGRSERNSEQMGAGAGGCFSAKGSALGGGLVPPQNPLCARLLRLKKKLPTFTREESGGRPPPPSARSPSPIPQDSPLLCPDSEVLPGGRLAAWLSRRRRKSTASPRGPGMALGPDPASLSAAAGRASRPLLASPRLASPLLSSPRLAWRRLFLPGESGLELRRKEGKTEGRREGKEAGRGREEKSPAGAALEGAPPPIPHSLPPSHKTGGLALLPERGSLSLLPGKLSWMPRHSFGGGGEARIPGAPEHVQSAFCSLGFCACLPACPDPTRPSLAALAC